MPIDAFFSLRFGNVITKCYLCRMNLRQTSYVAPEYAALGALQDFVCRLPDLFAVSGEVIYSKRNEVRVFEIAGQRWVVKRYKRPNLVQRLSCSLGRKSKAHRALLYADRLRRMGIDTPAPVAAVDCYRGLVYEQGYFVSAEDRRPSCMDLRDRPELPYREALAQALAHYLVTLHARGFLHGDTNLGNFLYSREADGTFRFAVIDVNRSRFVASPTRRQCLANLMRLSHRREVLRLVVGAYAAERGWDIAATVEDVIGRVRRFERRKELLRKLKRKKT